MTVALVATLLAAPVLGIDPHLDSSRVQTGCAACHRGHGASRSPMLAAPQREVCLSCHDSRARADRQVTNGVLSPAARPQLLATTLAQPFVHPLTDEAFSRRESGAVTCSSCHTPHRSMAEGPSGAAPPGRRKLSTRDPNRFEFELCESCHGSAGVTTQSLLDLSRLLNPNNRSFHPVEAPAADPSPSLPRELTGAEINCTDCHGNSDPAGARGPHGSGVRYLLLAEYVTVDGAEESPQTYDLCYRCHQRERVLDSPVFPLHRGHVVDERASCATCHSAHGSVDNRALMRFGEETFIAGVGPSGSTGLLAFVSAGPGAGSCYLTCHGVDHGPASYGGIIELPEALPAGGGLEALTLERPPARPPRPERPTRPPPER